MRCRESLEDGDKEQELETGEQEQEVAGRAREVRAEMGDRYGDKIDTLNGKPRQWETGRQKGKEGWKTERDQETDEMMKS